MASGRFVRDSLNLASLFHNSVQYPAEWCEAQRFVAWTAPRVFPLSIWRARPDISNLAALWFSRQGSSTKSGFKTFKTKQTWSAVKNVGEKRKCISDLFQVQPQIHHVSRLLSPQLRGPSALAPLGNPSVDEIRVEWVKWGESIDGTRSLWRSRAGVNKVVGRKKMICFS